MAGAATRPRRPPPGLLTAFGFAVLAVGALAVLAVFAGTAEVQTRVSVSSSSSSLRLRRGGVEEAAAAAAAREDTEYSSVSNMNHQSSDSSENKTDTSSRMQAHGPTGSDRSSSSGGGGGLQDSTQAGGDPDSSGTAASAQNSSSNSSSKAEEGLQIGGGDPAESRAGSSDKGVGASPSSPPPDGPQAAANSSDVELSCSEVLGIKKVAMLFLTTRRLAHEKLWRLWMWDAAGLVPAQALQGLQESACGAPPAAAAASWRRIQAACAPRPNDFATTPGGLVEMPQQHLFSIYVHAPPNYQSLEYQPLFQGRVLPQRLHTWWGTASITDAERLLLRAALADPLNHKFVLISDHDIPLYDPLTFYQQLMAEDRSKVVACVRPERRSIDRWKAGMETARLKKHHWRKSGQFFSLTRAHAEAVMQDSEVYLAFKERCGGRYPDGAWRECVPDEHYIPTLLAVLGLENQTYCGGWGVAYADWSAGGMHPRSFKPKEVTPGLLKNMQTCKNASEAAEDAVRMFVPVERIVGDSASETTGGGTSSGGAAVFCQAVQKALDESSVSFKHALHGDCPLTARKFPPFTSLRIRLLFLSSCPPGTGQVKSKAAVTFAFQRDPDLTLLRGQACTVGVEKVAPAKTPRENNNRRGGKQQQQQQQVGRTLLCAVREAAADWLPAADAFDPPFLDRLDEMCDAG